ncbi:MAG: MgtC/SapB transporter [Sphingobacteriaceae bacterium]|jgi:putative Mg2+ transporter-C (MgtC) family protein|nr:MgtC/SapB transporter [Sphingobacteriaceae bacterium]
MAEYLNTDDLLKLLLSIVCGGAIGFEREYKNKSAGFRTIILICMGSTVFSLISHHTNDDRIASTVVTGIGFIGAGVIFKDELWLKGLTTSAVIWVSAAIGMLIGMGHNLMGVITTICALIVLSIFNYGEKLIDRVHHRKQFSILFVGNDLQNLHELEQYMKMRGLSSKRMHVSKREAGAFVVIDVFGNKNSILNLNEYMVGLPQIASFQVAY